jgi:hypothetical protein
MPARNGNPVGIGTGRSCRVVELGRFHLEEEEQRRKLGESSDDTMFGAGAIGGLALIAIDAIWLVVGLGFNILFYFPVFMIIAGIVSMIRSLL